MLLAKVLEEVTIAIVIETLILLQHYTVFKSYIFNIYCFNSFVSAPLKWQTLWGVVSFRRGKRLIDKCVGIMINRGCVHVDNTQFAFHLPRMRHYMHIYRVYVCVNVSGHFFNTSRVAIVTIACLK
jgi:hypothetical protein